MAASSSASPAKAPNSCARSLGRRIDSANTESMLRSRTTGTAASTSRTTRSIVPDSAAGDDRDAHRPEIVAHDELVVVDDFKGPSIVGGVVLERSSDRIWSSIRRQTGHGNRSQHARYGAKPVEDALICLRACIGI